MQDSKDYKAPSNYDVGHQGDSCGQAQYPETPFPEPGRVPAQLAGQSRPGMAQGEGDANQEEEEGSGEAGQIKPESFGHINLIDHEVVQVECQVEYDHQNHGHSTEKVHLPEAGRLAVIHRA